jgi:hypothetical protein
VTFPQSRLSNYKDISGGDHPVFYMQLGSAAAFGEKIKVRVESGLEPRGDHKSAHGTNRFGPVAPCVCSRAGL